VYEEKYDGWRMLAYEQGRRGQLVSRLGQDYTGRLPRLAAVIAAMRPFALILDGTVARFDETLVSRFEWLGRRAPDVATLE
jgi:bifunctional non-homologous end joining protein LigD